MKKGRTKSREQRGGAKKATKHSTKRPREYMKLKPVLLAVAPAFCIGLFYAAIVTARATASFPFARTLISCKQLTPANIDRGSDAWSGSPSCGNVDTVVSQATFIRGYVANCCCSLSAKSYLNRTEKRQAANRFF